MDPMHLLLNSTRIMKEMLSVRETPVVVMGDKKGTKYCTTQYTHTIASGTNGGSKPIGGQLMTSEIHTVTSIEAAETREPAIPGALFSRPCRLLSGPEAACHDT